MENVVSDSYLIKRISTMDEVHQIMEIMRKAWDLSDLEIVPSFEIKAVSDFGIVLTARPREDPEKIVGYIYGFPMFPDKHYSHMMAIDPNYQNQNIGFLLKKAHYNLVLNSTNPRVRTIHWTFDPLLPQNAYLNFHKLGCVCADYRVNYYGKPKGIGIYEGVSSDRLYVSWIVDSEVVKNCMQGFSEREYENLVYLNQIIDFRRNEKKEGLNSTQQSYLAVEVPANYQDIRVADLEQAIYWRRYFRETAIQLFKRGYQIIDYLSDSKHQKNHYIFSLKNEL